MTKLVGINVDEHDKLMLANINEMLYAPNPKSPCDGKLDSLYKKD